MNEDVVRVELTDSARTALAQRASGSCCRR